MPDIFGRVDQLFGGGLSADSMFMTWPSLPAGGAGLLVQSIGLQYQQPVRRIFELGPGRVNPDSGTRSQLTYYIVGRPEGNFQMQRIFGFAAIGTQFYKTYGNPCNENPSLSFNANAGCNGNDNGQSMIWTLDGVLLTAVGMTATAQEMVIQDTVGGMFISFHIETFAQGADGGLQLAGDAAAGAAEGAAGAAIDNGAELLPAPVPD